MITLLPRGTLHRFDLDDTVSLCFNITSKDSVNITKEVVDELARSHLDVLLGDPGICNTMTTMEIHLEAVKGLSNVILFGLRRMVHRFYPCLAKAHNYRTSMDPTNRAFKGTYVPLHLHPTSVTISFSLAPFVVDARIEN